jgi:hypothetical protein
MLQELIEGIDRARRGQIVGRDFSFPEFIRWLDADQIP